MHKDFPTDRTIRVYLLGQLHDQPVLEQHLSERLLVDSDLSDFVDLVEEELIEDYLDGTLQGSDRTAFETYFLLPPERKKELEFQQLLHRRRPAVVIKRKKPWINLARRALKGGMFLEVIRSWAAGFGKRRKLPWIKISKHDLKSSMFLHMHSEYIESAKIKEYLAWTQQYILPAYRAAPGFLSATLLRREFTHYSDIAVLSAWDSKESLTAFFTNSPYLSAPDPPVPRLSHRDAHAFEILSKV